MADRESDPADEPQQGGPADAPAAPPQDESASPDGTTPFEAPIMDSVQGSDDFPPPPRRNR